MVSIAALTFSLSLTGCEEKPAEGIPEEQLVFFQYEYINHAWGYMHNGWLIDSTGSVYCYEQPEYYAKADSMGYVNLEDLDRMISEYDTVCYVIEPSTLRSNAELIAPAAEGELSLPDNRMADAGIRSYYAYLYDSDTQKYKRVLLLQEGDWEIINQSAAANDLADWMKLLRKEIATGALD